MPSPAAPAQVVSRAFPSETASVPAVRRFVRGALSDAGQEQWLDEAQLVVSELATNAVLHAHTAFEVTVHAGGEGVYVQVWDDDALPPARRVSDAASTTGRGLELVEAVATSYGVQSVGPTKVVWFCLGMARPEGADDVLLDRWRDRPADEACPAAGDAQTVTLAGMPLALWLSAREHHNALMREFSLHQQAASSTPGRVPVRLVDADRARSLVLSALRGTAVAPAVDVHLSVRPEQGAWFAALRDVLDEAERLATAGELLAPPGPPVILAVRHWATGQALAQLAGAAPQRWAGPLSLREAASGPAGRA